MLAIGYQIEGELEIKALFRIFRQVEQGPKPKVLATAYTFVRRCWLQHTRSSEGVGYRIHVRPKVLATGYTFVGRCWLQHTRSKVLATAYTFHRFSLRSDTDLKVGVYRDYI